MYKVTFSGALAPQDSAQQMCAYLRAFAESLPVGVENGQVVPSQLSRDEIRSRILTMEASMFAEQARDTSKFCDIDQTMPLKHLFAPGAYGRQITVPAGHWVIGKIHKHAHLNFVMKGRCVVLTEEGPMVIQAPFSFVSSVGTKRVVLAIEELVWATVHLTNETDLAKIEDEVIAKTYEDVPQLAVQKVEVLQ